MSLAMVPVGFDHGRWQFEMAIICKKAFPELDWTGPVTLNFDDKTNPEPDLIAWKDGNPIIIVEISNSTQKADFGYKKALYEANGIPYYAVLNVQDRRLHTWGVKDGAYIPDPDWLQGLRDLYQTL